MSALTDAVKKLDDGRKMIDRLEKVVDKLYDTFDEEPIISLVESEIRMELLYAEKDHIGLAGSGNANIKWKFTDIVDGWISVYSDDTQESNDSLRRMGDQFCKLGKMFHQAAEEPAAQ